MLIPVIEKVSIAKGALSVTLQDTTGAYNASTNPGGYGTPNLASPPAVIGLTWRQWIGTENYSNFVSADSGLIAELLTSGGHKFLATDLGLTKFAEGVHQIKYYPFDPVPGSDTFSLAADSKVVTLVSGTFDPTSLNSTYVAVLLKDGSGTIKSSVLLLGDRNDWSSTEFTLESAWPETVTGYTVQFATEADLKILVKEATEACIAGKVAKIAKMECCEHKVVNKLTELTMWLFSAEIKLQCGEYQAANDLIASAYKECTYCISEDCKTCQ